jgi:hypothetical protein
MLYHSLEQEVIPEFYARDGQGIPTAWVARMRESMARLTPQFSANRAVREYTEQQLVAQLKVRHGLKIVVVSNEARELNAYRIRKFKLDEFVILYFLLLRPHPQARRGHLSACAGHRPDASRTGRLYRKHPMFVQIAEGLGIRSILHTDYKSTCAKLASFGLQNDEGVIHETS